MQMALLCIFSTIFDVLSDAFTLL